MMFFQVLIVCGLILTIEDIHIQQYPSSLYEIVYVLGYFVIHFLLVGFLIAGAFKVSCLHHPILYFLLFLRLNTTYKSD